MVMCLKGSQSILKLVPGNSSVYNVTKNFWSSFSNYNELQASVIKYYSNSGNVSGKIVNNFYLHFSYAI